MLPGSAGGAEFAEVGDVVRWLSEDVRLAGAVEQANQLTMRLSFSRVFTVGGRQVRRRDYSGPDDLIAMQRAVQRCWTPDSRWHVGDLAWQRHVVTGDPAVALWARVDGAVVAWGWMSSPGHLDLHVDPRRPDLAAEVLDWFADAASGDQHTVTVMDTDRHVTAMLAARGYHRLTDQPFFTHCVRDLDQTLPTVGVPDGYRVRAVRPDEAAPRAAAHRAAWRPARIGTMLVPPRDLGDAPSGMTTDRYQAVMNTWPYRPDLDQVVEAPDGTIAAFALGWLDAINQVGELEPVGTDPVHGRHGLGTAVSLACLHALRAAGATRAVVYPRGDPAYPVPGHLYHRLGFRPTARTVTYGRLSATGAPIS